MFRALTASVLVLYLVACASPEVVAKKKASDASLTCEGITHEAKEAQTFLLKANDVKGFNTRNVVTGVLFWPAVAGTYYNAKDATAAAEERKENLIALATQKQCDMQALQAAIDAVQLPKE